MYKVIVRIEPIINIASESVQVFFLVPRYYGIKARVPFMNFHVIVYTHTI